jgi:hypothetical protein
MQTSNSNKLAALPKGISESDTKWLSRSEQYTADYDSHSFELFYTERFGWVIPCLHISNATRLQRARGAATDRSYAIGVNDHKLVSVGKGLHVKRVVTVHVRAKREAALLPFIALRREGLEKASEYRDQLSSRRMQSRSRSFSMWGV